MPCMQLCCGAAEVAAMAAVDAMQLGNFKNSRHARHHVCRPCSIKLIT